MYVIEKIRRQIDEHQADGSDRILGKLLQALEEEDDFPLHKLYALNYTQFQLALELLQSWRLARHCHNPVSPESPSRQAS